MFNLIITLDSNDLRSYLQLLLLFCVRGLSVLLNIHVVSMFAIGNLYASQSSGQSNFRCETNLKADDTQNQSHTDFAVAPAGDDG